MPTDTAYQRNRRHEARKNGLCGTCCKRPAVEWRCDHCKAKLKLQPGRTNPERHELERRRNPPDDFCIDCQAHGRHRADCPTQRKERAA